jgi:predicted nucleic acid-binding protein
VIFLADTTVWAWAKRDDAIRNKLADRVTDGDVFTCVPIALEVLHSARTGTEYDEDLTETLGPLEWIPMSEAAGLRALEVQRALAHTTHGAHRIPAVDFLIAALAEKAERETVLWHVDRDLGRICTFVGQAQEYETLKPRRSSR